MFQKHWVLWITGAFCFAASIVVFFVYYDLLAKDLGKAISYWAATVALISTLMTILNWLSRHTTLWPRVKVLYHAIRVNLAWAKLVGKAGSEAIPMATAFIRRYIDEEVKDISGQAKGQKGKDFIVTNFVAYSGYVRTIVDTAINNKSNSDALVCFTTLTMPVCQFFNFRKYRKAKADQVIPFYQADGKWNEYTDDLRVLVGYHPRPGSGNSGRKPPDELPTLRRCVLAVKQALANEYMADPSFVFQGEERLVRYLNHWILVPIKEGRTSFQSLAPLPKVQIMRWLEGELKAEGELRVYRHTDKDAQAYLIYPSPTKARDELPEIPGFHWERTGSAFIQLFHSRERPQNARYKVLTDDEWLDYFVNRTELERIPEDLFIVGYRRKGSSEQEPIRWICCLAAEVDNSLDKLALEFLSEKSQQKRWEAITSYADQLYRDSPLLQDLIAKRISEKP